MILLYPTALAQHLTPALHEPDESHMKAIWKPPIVPPSCGLAWWGRCASFLSFLWLPDVQWHSWIISKHTWNKHVYILNYTNQLIIVYIKLYQTLINIYIYTNIGQDRFGQCLILDAVLVFTALWLASLDILLGLSLVSCQVRWRIQRLSLVCRGRILRSDPSCFLCLSAMQMTGSYGLESLRPCNLRCGQTLAGKLLGYPTLAELRQIPIHLQVWGYLLRWRHLHPQSPRMFCNVLHLKCIRIISRGCISPFVDFLVLLAQFLLSWTRCRKFQPRNKKQPGMLWFKYSGSTGWAIHFTLSRTCWLVVALSLKAMRMLCDLCRALSLSLAILRDPRYERSRIGTHKYMIHNDKQIISI